MSPSNKIMKRFLENEIFSKSEFSKTVFIKSIFQRKKAGKNLINFKVHNFGKSDGDII